MASKSGIKKFRSDIATLKRKGLLSGVDARSATPSRRLNKILDKYDAVLSGKASAVKLSSKGLKEYKDLGKPYEIAAPKGLPRRVIVPHDAGEKVHVSHGKVTISNPAGLHRTIIPVKYHSLPQYFRELKKKTPKLKDDEYFAFRFFGNRSHKAFRSIDALVNSLEHYESIFDAIEENDAEGQAELYQNLEIIRIDRPADWTAPLPMGRQTYRGSTRYQKRKDKLERAPEWKQAQEREANKERQREYRARLKGAALDDYNKQGRKRAAKSKKAKQKSKRKKKK